MANVKITELTAYTNPASTDVVPIVDLVNDQTKKVSIADLLENAGAGTASAAAFSFDGDPDTGMYRSAANELGFTTAGTGRLFIDSSGKLLVGTSSARDNYFGGTSGTACRFEVEGSDYKDSGASFTSTNNTIAGWGPHIALGRTRGSGDVIVNDDDGIGSIIFHGNDGSTFVPSARIDAFIDGTPGTDDMPGRLVFSTSADGASSPTERMTIDNAGSLIYGTSTSPGADITSGTGFYYQISTGLFYVRSNSAPVAAFNRGANDGTLVEFKQDQVTEGTISVSGTTVSYNGAHLSRWSQLPSGAERTEILRGSVLSNLDEMCEWGDEDNEQLNRMQVSNVEGDRNVAGVFQAWDDDDDTYTNDFYCAMTGDFIIRIGAGVTVERGDLLMSAGDGTAKPQGDGFVQDKTVAKVTSTTVSITYADGSYCVPCVLMAC